MPLTFHSDEEVRKIVELRKRGWGYRRIADYLNKHGGHGSKNSVMRVVHAWQNGLIEVQEDGTVIRHEKPTGVIKRQAEAETLHSPPIEDPAEAKPVQQAESSNSSMDMAVVGLAAAPIAVPVLVDIGWFIWSLIAPKPKPQS
jgi:hypothetical protein